MESCSIPNAPTTVGRGSGFAEDALVVGLVGVDDVVGAELFLGVEAGDFAYFAGTAGVGEKFGGKVDRCNGARRRCQASRHKRLALATGRRPGTKGANVGHIHTSGTGNTKTQVPKPGLGYLLPLGRLRDAILAETVRALV